MIPVYEPWLTEVERTYLLSAFDSGWLSWSGAFVRRAEEALQELLGAKRVHLTSSGTTALHLCLRALGVGPGDKVLIPGTTFVATAFAAAYERCELIFVDADKDTWNIDLDLVEEVISREDIRAIIPVHLYGNPVDMVRLVEMCGRHGVAIVEDACESLGGQVGERSTGTLGDIGVFSFYANKALASGEGGCIVTDNDELADRSALLRGQAQDPGKRYWHTDIGYNYRMTNLQAAVLCGQLERFEEIDREKKRVARSYQRRLLGVAGIHWQDIPGGCEHARWLITVTTNVPYPAMAQHLRAMGIDSRPIFYPLCDMPMFRNFRTLSKSGGGGVHALTVGDHLNRYGISLPSSPTLTDASIDYICEILCDGVGKYL